MVHRHGELAGSSSFVSKMEAAHLIEVVQPPPTRLDRKGRSRGGKANTFYFTPETLDLYRRQGTVEDAEIRKAIGQYIYVQYQHHPNEVLDYDVEEVASKSSVDPQRVREQTRVLRDLGILQDVGPIDSAIEFGPLVLTPDGLRWAVRGFGDELFAGPTVNVSVQVDIHNFIQEVRDTSVPENLKAEAAELVKDIQREPAMEKVSRLFGLAANAQQLAPAVMKFVTENGSALMQHLPGV